MPADRRTVRAIVALALTALLGLGAAGCATPATAAATVGDTTIAESLVFERSTAFVDRAIQAGGQAPDAVLVADVNRTTTTTAIRSRLLQLAAADAGLVVTREQVNAALASSARADIAVALDVSDPEVEDAIRDRLLVEGLAQRLPPGGAVVTDVLVQIDGVSVPTRAEAVSLRARMAVDPVSADGIIADSPLALPASSLSLLTAPNAGAAGLFLAAPGEVIIYPNPDGFYVLRILSRTTQEGVLTADTVLQQPVRGAANLMALRLVPYADQQGVRVNPRIGLWDPLALQVVPGSSP